MHQIQSSKRIFPRKQTLGGFQINFILWLCFPLIILASFYAYYMAITNHQQKPWPWSTISDTSCHYPQDIVVRFNMLLGSSIMMVTFYVIFKWMERECERVGYRKISRLYHYMMQFSVLCYSITIGTLDQKDTGPLHTPSAIAFFIIWMIVIIKVTLFLHELRKWDTTTLGQTSMLIKLSISLYLTFIWIYCAYGLIDTSPDEQNKKSDMYIVILEWNSYVGNLLWFLSFVFQFREVRICLDFYPKYEGNRPEIQNFSVQETKNHQQREIDCWVIEFLKIIKISIKCQEKIQLSILNIIEVKLYQFSLFFLFFLHLLFAKFQ